MDYVIIVNDNGELKTISAAELVHEARGGETAEQLYVLINAILDKRSAAKTQALALAEGSLTP